MVTTQKNSLRNFLKYRFLNKPHMMFHCSTMLWKISTPF